MNMVGIHLTKSEISVRARAIDVTYDIASFLANKEKLDKDLIENIKKKISELLQEPIITRNKHIVYSKTNESGGKQVFELNRILSTLLLGFGLIDVLMERNDIEKLDSVYNKIEYFYMVITNEVKIEGWDKIIRDGTIELRQSIRHHVGDIIERIDGLTPIMLLERGVKESIKSGRDIITILKSRVGKLSKTSYLGKSELVRIGDIQGIEEVIQKLEILIELADNSSSDPKELARAFMDLKELTGAILES